MTGSPLPVLAVLGGTGQEGSGLALRWALAGHDVVLGSRDPMRAAAVAAELNARVGRDAVRGLGNHEAAVAAEIAVLTVPYAAQQATALDVRAGLEGKILVDATVPLVPPKVSRVQLPSGGSAVAALQDALGPGVRVVSAFQNVSAHHLKDVDHAIDCDVLVCGDDAEARRQVIALAGSLGLRGLDAGALCNSAAAEALTSVLIAINRAYKVPGTGLRITGLPAATR